MTDNTESTHDQTRQNDIDRNFRALEAKFQRQLDEERQHRIEAERRLSEMHNNRKPIIEEEEEDDPEPYINHKKLNKTMSKFEQNTGTSIDKAMRLAKEQAKEELKEEMWIENNPDFYQTLQLAEKFHQRAPKLAENILKMPEGFERQKLVYYNIKELGLDKPEVKQSSIQETVNKNRQTPFYQPTGVGSAPYSQQSDFSESGKKAAYDKMQELKSRLKF